MAKDRERKCSIRRICERANQSKIEMKTEISKAPMERNRDDQERKLKAKK